MKVNNMATAIVSNSMRTTYPLPPEGINPVQEYLERRRTEKKLKSNYITCLIPHIERVGDLDTQRTAEALWDYTVEDLHELYNTALKSFKGFRILLIRYLRNP